MAQIQSQNEKDMHNSSSVFIPSIAATVLYTLLGLILMMVYNSGSIMQRLSGDYIGSPEHLKTNFTTLSNNFSNSFSTALGGRLGQIIVWSFIGAVTYIGVWLIRSVLNSFENDVISDSYVHPSNYSRAGYWSSSLSVKIFLAALTLMAIGFTLVAVRSILPSISALAGSAVYNFSWPDSLFYLAFSVVAAWLVIYAFVTLLRLVSRLWKRF